ncbi:MAG TPA: hypothetical protein VEY91_08745 [Candidatus Limnocylindria bacterium]|nr:hypothetical protein [Candidatus Limnocylindria bacterium]
MKPASVTASADCSRSIPERAGARLDAIDAALSSLDHESRRLERLGFERPLARCAAQRRYWSFLQALFSIPAATPRPGFGDVTCPAAPRR